MWRLQQDVPMGKSTQFSIPVRIVFENEATEDFFLAPQIEDPNEKRPTPEDLFLAPLIVPRPLEKEPSKSEFPRNMFI
ncbi:uncharacterized protein LOC123681025 isoform X3 [Harmonia axyridis]|uniref:uncharacterized protein LOC123681025 isoform X3 n=1 Tax=Harmonia axyridis TaxID=115357 RepID=UPI001E279016|nr:uncharacterized protein LOC123681025 isoform X3 [Harmonia axyridis]